MLKVAGIRLPSAERTAARDMGSIRPTWGTESGYNQHQVIKLKDRTQTLDNHQVNYSYMAYGTLHTARRYGRPLATHIRGSGPTSVRIVHDIMVVFTGRKGRLDWVGRPTRSP